MSQNNPQDTLIILRDVSLVGGGGFQIQKSKKRNPNQAIL